jgi:ubiquinone/menaquinone biosynthesis C-methylase UbiE
MTQQQYIPALRFHRLTNIYDWLIGNLMPEKKYKLKVIEQAIQSGKEVVLDFGVGTGTLSLMLKQKYPQTKVIGLDVDEKIISIAKRKFREQDVAVNIIKYNGTEFPMFQQQFDCIISSLVFHHLTDKQKEETLRWLFTRLPSNGVIVVADWGKSTGYVQRLLFYIVQLLDGFTTTQSSVEGKLPEFMRRAGFENITEEGTYKTILGTLRIFKSVKP